MNRKESHLMLKLCDKLSWQQLLELGAYLIACSFHKRKPTVGTEGCSI